MADYIKRVKTLLGIDDDLQDSLLEEIQENTAALYKALTSEKVIPVDHDFMIVEVMVKRYNRIGNEGMLQERQADMLQVFDSSDFSPYMDILNERFKPPEKREKGGVYWR